MVDEVLEEIVLESGGGYSFIFFDSSVFIFFEES
jgi:hypothetical protein